MAENEKELGNAAYKSKNYIKALQHYDAAIALDGTNIVYYTNKAAVLLEQKKYDECIKVCLEGIDVGRSNGAEKHLLAKAYTRIGNAYAKQLNHSEAEKYYLKSQREFHTDDVDRLITEIQQMRLSVNDRENGNKYYRQNDFTMAIYHYNEAIKKCPVDVKLYGNRAQCFLKMRDFNSAINDSETCIRLDPSYVKGYIRKGCAYLELKDFNRALTAFQDALKLDASNQEAIMGLERARAGLGLSSSTSAYCENRSENMFGLDSPVFGDNILENISKEFQNTGKSIKKGAVKFGKLLTGKSSSAAPK